MTRSVIDISQFQGTFNAQVARARGIDGVYCRAAHWPNPDTRFGSYVTLARAAGLEVGAYHFIEPSQGSAAAHAAQMLQLCGGRPLTLPCMIDVERSVTVAWLNEYILRCTAGGLRLGIIYLNDSSGLDLRPLPQTFDLVAPDYVKGTPPAPADWFTWASARKPAGPGIPIGWDTWDMWQFSADGNGQAATYGCTGASADIDLDIVRDEAWARWTNRDERLTVADAVQLWGGIPT